MFASGWDVWMYKNVVLFSFFVSIKYVIIQTEMKKDAMKYTMKCYFWTRWSKLWTVNSVQRILPGCKKKETTQYQKNSINVKWLTELTRDRTLEATTRIIIFKLKFINIGDIPFYAISLLYFFTDVGHYNQNALNILFLIRWIIYLLRNNIKYYVRKYQTPLTISP